MEARARAAVSRLQEVTAGGREAPIAAVPGPPPSLPAEPTAAPETAPAAPEVHVPAAEAETISRTLLLAQRTADAAIADAQAEAERIRNEAQTEADSTIDSTREMSAKLLEDARAEARRATEAERAAAENEVQSLVARRAFLIGDVDQLEKFLVDQRERLRGAARQIEALCDRVPAGLGKVNPPVLSASDDGPGDDTAQMFRPSAERTDADEVELDETQEIDPSDAPDGARDHDGANDHDGAHDGATDPDGADDHDGATTS